MYSRKVPYYNIYNSTKLHLWGKVEVKLRYGLSLCNKNSQRYMFSNAPTCYLYICIIYQTLFYCVFENRYLLEFLIQRDKP